MKHLNEKYIDACESLGWTVTEYEDGSADLSQYSPAGEDFSFCVETENFAEEIRAYYNGFDPDEHAEMWIEAKRNGAGGVPSIRRLIEDADAIDSMLEDLAIAVAQVGHE